MLNKKKTQSGIVYSTQPGWSPESAEAREPETLVPGKQSLILRLDTRHRAGKTLTILEGFTGRQADLEALGKKLKTHCGTGGSVKDGQILIQGDQREKLFHWLTQNGYGKLRRK